MYIARGPYVKRSEEIYLERCFLPNIGSYFEHRVEPGLWFKTLTLDSIFVDCTERSVSWVSKDDSEATKLHDGILEQTLHAVQEVFRNKGNLKFNTVPSKRLSNMLPVISIKLCLQFNRS